jgi:hypothetical protein
VPKGCEPKSAIVRPGSRPATKSSLFGSITFWVGFFSGNFFGPREADGTDDFDLGFGFTELETPWHRSRTNWCRPASNPVCLGSPIGHAIRFIRPKLAGLEVGLGAIFASGPNLPFWHEVGEYKRERYGAIRANRQVDHATGVSSRDAAKTPNRG